MSYASMMQYKRKGEQYFRQGEFIHAEKAFNSALEEARLYQPANEYTAQQLKVMSTFYLTIGIYAKAEHYLIQALEIEENLVEQESMKIVETLNMLGLLYIILEGLQPGGSHVPAGDQTGKTGTVSSLSSV